MRELNIDLTRSWLVGDTTTDLQAAHNAGLRSILVRTGYGGGDGQQSAAADYVLDDLRSAVRFIVKQGGERTH